MVLPVSPKVGLDNIFHDLTNMRIDVHLKTYSEMPLISKQPNAILKFCSIYHWCKAGAPKFDNTNINALNIKALNLHHSAGSFFAYIANYSG